MKPPKKWASNDITFWFAELIEATRVLCVLWIALLGGCAIEGPADLIVERIYLADRSALPNYRDAISKTLIDPIAIAVEVSTQASFFGGALTRQGFCGETISIAGLGDGNLYTIGDIDLSPEPLGHRYRYLMLVDLKSRRWREADRYPSYDLTRAAREVCLQTDYGLHAPSYWSRLLRISPSTIAEIIREGVKPLPQKLGRGL